MLNFVECFFFMSMKYTYTSEPFLIKYSVVSTANHMHILVDVFLLEAKLKLVDLEVVRPDSCKQSDSCKHTNYTHIRMFI